jgi:hypothetical protein
MAHDQLAAAFARLKELPLPSPPDSDELASWRAELIQMDAFYAGIASTLLSGGRLEHYPEDLDTLEATLRSIQPRTELDRTSLDEARGYVAQLRRVREAVMATL